ncbi:hypothetical protein BDV96DRAFT_591700 [Lophiotrema nucula]|uniref:Uncharacterized protein n=1 Tax=Lophiotrema nucula TaxID=690887 RepID=A0A6A5YGD6_9PLEO|nr:hypothetical protein BDV96DRAFT_591700 [Lophiotrema nucula]
MRVLAVTIIFALPLLVFYPMKSLTVLWEHFKVQRRSWVSCGIRPHFELDVVELYQRTRTAAQ